MTDRVYADAVNAEVDEMVEKYWRMAEAVYERVYGRFQ
jgi:hypothetical protein